MAARALLLSTMTAPTTVSAKPACEPWPLFPGLRVSQVVAKDRRLCAATEDGAIHCTYGTDVPTRGDRIVGVSGNNNSLCLETAGHGVHCTLDSEGRHDLFRHSMLALPRRGARFMPRSGTKVSTDGRALSAALEGCKGTLTVPTHLQLPAAMQEDGRWELRGLEHAPPAFRACVGPRVTALTHRASPNAGYAELWALPAVERSQLAAFRHATDVDLSYARECALDATGEIRCAEHGNALGLGPAVQGDLFSIGYPIPLDEPAVALRTGYRHGCAIGLSGRLHCWGDSERGLTWTSGPREQWSPPKRVEPFTHVTRLVISGDNTCVVEDGRRLTCWGSFRLGEDAKRSFTEITRQTDGADIESIAVEPNYLAS